MSTLQTKQPSSLLRLPNEILDQIINDLDNDSWPNNRKNVRNFRLTCKRICELSEPAFFRYLHSADPTQSDHLDLMLKMRPERHDRVRTLVLYPDKRSRDHGFERMVRCIPRLPRLKTLHVQGVSAIDVPLFTALNVKLHSSTFAELRECTLVAHEYLPCLIAPLLNAPKLTTLKVSFPLLDHLDDALPQPKSTPLKHLALFMDSFTNQESISAILSTPAELETLEFRACHWEDDYSPPQFESRVLEHLLRSVARHQPALKALKLRLCASRITSVPNCGQFDYRQLPCLKELSFFNNEIIPVNCFSRFPDSLETVRFHSEVHLSALAIFLTAGPHNFSVGRDETLPLHVQVYVNHAIDRDLRLERYGTLRYLEMPLTSFEHKMLQEKLTQIDTFMTRLPFPKLTVTDRDERFERRITATRTNFNSRNPNCKSYEVHVDFHTVPYPGFNLLNTRQRRGNWSHGHSPAVRGLTSVWE